MTFDKVLNLCLPHFFMVNMEYNNTNIIELLEGLNDLNKYFYSVSMCIYHVGNQNMLALMMMMIMVVMVVEIMIKCKNVRR